MEDSTNDFKISIGNLMDKDHWEVLGSDWKIVFRLDLGEKEIEKMIQLAKSEDQWRDLIVILNLRVP